MNLKSLVEPDTPIELNPDDGLRLISHGRTTPLKKDGPRFEYAVFHNPFLVANVLALKHERALIREANIRRFS